MGEKKMVSRNVAIALGIICIILAVSLVGSVLVYSSAVTSLNSEVNDLNAEVNLGKFTTWVENQIVTQSAEAYSSWTFSTQYAGYVSVWLFSNTNNTYVRVIYTCRYQPILQYDHEIDIGTNGTVCFPILPSNGIEIRVGNTNAINNATENIADIIYYY